MIKELTSGVLSFIAPFDRMIPSKELCTIEIESGLVGVIPAKVERALKEGEGTEERHA